MVIKVYTAQITMRMYGYFVKLTKPYTRSIIEPEKERSPHEKTDDAQRAGDAADQRVCKAHQTLSKQSGVPLRTIESWCRRLRVPRDVYQLLKLSKVLGCQIEDLIEPEAGEKKQEE